MLNFGKKSPDEQNLYSLSDKNTEARKEYLHLSKILSDVT